MRLDVRADVSLRPGRMGTSAPTPVSALQSRVCSSAAVAVPGVPSLFCCSSGCPHPEEMDTGRPVGHHSVARLPHIVRPCKIRAQARAFTSFSCPLAHSPFPHPNGVPHHSPASIAGIASHPQHTPLSALARQRRPSQHACHRRMAFLLSSPSLRNSLNTGRAGSALNRRTAAC
jgi:hypothetical protein